MDSNEDDLSDPEIKLGTIYFIPNLAVDHLLRDVNKLLVNGDSLDDIIMGLRIIFSLNTTVKYSEAKQKLVDISLVYVEKVLKFWQRVQSKETRLSSLAATKDMDDNIMITPLTLYDSSWL